MIDLDQPVYRSGLHRPECAGARGRNVAHGRLAGRSRCWPPREIWSLVAKGDFQPKPNGIAILRDGGWLLTYLGDTTAAYSG